MDLREIVAGFEGLQVAVLGDLMMDEYLWGDASRVSPESPVLVIDVQRETAVPGGAANVAANLMALGATTKVFGAVGDDGAGADLRDKLAERGADVLGIVTDASRPTTRKTRVVAQNQQVLRIDREHAHDLAGPVASELARRLLGSIDGLDAVLASDYDKGVVNEATVPPAVARARAGSVPFLVNAKPDNVGLLKGASVVTLNIGEALAASGDKRFRTDEIGVAGQSLREAIGCDALVVTRGPKGLAVWTDDAPAVLVPAKQVEVYDVAGAGDTVVSTMTLAVAAGAGLREAAELAVHAAAVVVGKVGVATVTRDELLAHFED
ncbi:MAG: bifunctional hydroxymethylpyrimidine kinase/phosphomethylpyrimidine kinase [Armatimonadetes bacterium]|nr:bifunctional hydroxymethylpyrimidine kinase/phosphomethylpyrimidine kinase [Armatimonadota bacterium]